MDEKPGAATTVHVYAPVADGAVTNLISTRRVQDALIMRATVVSLSSLTAGNKFLVLSELVDVWKDLFPNEPIPETMRGGVWSGNR